MIDGKLQWLSTHMTNKNEARDKEREIISQVRSGKPPAPSPVSLVEFLRGSFLPYVEVNFRQKPKTRDYYVFGARRLERGILSKLELDQIDSKRSVNSFIHSVKSFRLLPSTRHCGPCAGP